MVINSYQVTGVQVVTLSFMSSVLLYFFAFIASSEAVKLKASKWFRVLLVSLVPVLMGGSRYYIGADYGSYAWGYDVLKSRSWENIFANFNFFGSSIAFEVITKFMASIDWFWGFWAITSALSLIPVVLYLFKDWETENAKYSVVPGAIFIYLIYFYTFGWAAIRQGIAIAFCFYSMTYIFNRRPVKFLGTVLLACLFHSTAVIFLPLYFLWGEDGKVAAWKKFIAVAFCFIFIVCLGYFISIIGGRFAGYVGEVEGRNLTFFVMLFFSMVFLFFRKRLLELDRRNELLILMFVMGTMLQFLGFHNAFTKRIGMYFLTAQCILLPNLAHCFRGKNANLLWLVIVIFEMLLFIFPAVVQNSVLYIPYSFIID